ncbi:hypothetical protein EPUS_05196 [Endocarpon pusillum Z07020]|uniref:Uncharacterized protein n=1 Tax=Endocarpon pusillum (strain Z07020 / HMAS-L-300199) TaxID=1263415 RepID=U1FZK7_ENDPU|nr:uncharacterized protein EPUS_05196 [Endocarpon pusillum Z07020]ERF70377.1 hypothetical protein EPUS_05196 [Endocarpon pusillum Z07020]
MALPLDGFDTSVDPDDGHVLETSNSPFKYVANNRLNKQWIDRSLELSYQRLTSKTINHDIFESRADFLLYAFYALHLNSIALDSDSAAKISSTLEDLARNAKDIRQNYPGVTPSPQQRDDFFRMVESAHHDLSCSGLMIAEPDIICTLFASIVFEGSKKCTILSPELCFDTSVAEWKNDLGFYLLLLGSRPKTYTPFLQCGYDLPKHNLLNLCMAQIERAITEKERIHQSLSTRLDGGYGGGNNQPDPDGNNPDRTQDPKDGQGQVRGPQGLGGSSFSRRSGGNNANPSIDGSYSWKVLFRKSVKAYCLSTACQFGHSNQNRTSRMSFKTIQARDYLRLVLD